MLPSGRFLSYNEYGSLQNYKLVIFYFHSLGSSRLEIPNLEHDKICKFYKIKFIHVDRPGFGQSTCHSLFGDNYCDNNCDNIVSDFVKCENVTKNNLKNNLHKNLKNNLFFNFAKDINDLSNILNIDKYIVMGNGIGGLYALGSSYLNLENKIISCITLNSNVFNHFNLFENTIFGKFENLILKITKFIPNLILILILKFLSKYFLKIIFKKQFKFLLNYLIYKFENKIDFYNFCKENLISIKEGMNQFGFEFLLKELKMEKLQNWDFNLKSFKNNFKNNNLNNNFKK
ncbi:hypothetical protein ABK040_007311 [Willaertia magna]